MSLYPLFYNVDAKLINYTIVQGESIDASNTDHIFYDGDDKGFPSQVTQDA